MSFASALASYNWKEITHEFKDACTQLELGELLKDQSFGLFEAMSAIEMMDPKMDAGMMENQAQTKIKSFKQAVEDKLVKINDFGLDEKVAIVDNTLCNLITWLDGASLAQTVFTNLYLHDPNIIEDAYIKCFSLAMLKIIDWMRNKIMTSGTYEEEDFQPMNYSFKFASDVTDSSVLASLKANEDASAKLYRHLKGEQKGDQPDQQLQIDLAFALWMRMKLIRALFQILQFTDEHAAFSKQADDIKKHLSVGLEALVKVRETHKFGVEPVMIKIAKTTYPVVMGFEPSVNQRLLPPTFPRFIRIFTFEATCDYLKETFEKLSETFKLAETTTFQQMFELGLSFSKVNSIFLRSMFQLIALPRVPIEKILKMKDILLNSVQKFISPPILNQKLQIANREVCSQFVDNFLNKCTPVFINLFQILGHNNARQREKFGHTLEEFANLQEEADALDRIIQSFVVQQKLSIPSMPCFGSWILHNNLDLMRLYLITGFELDLFSKFEYYYVYWYLCEVILKWQANTLNRAENFLTSLDQYVTSNQKSAKKPSKKKNKPIYEKEIALLTAERHMYSAYYQSLRALKEEKILQSPNEEFECEEFRYNHRFAPFQFFQNPPVCMYHQYKANDAHFIKSVTINKMYYFAQEHFETARSIYEKHPEYQSFTKIAKTNFVVLRLLSSGLKKCQNLELDFAESSLFPQKLKEASILDENEPILCFIQVVDFLKQQQQFKKIVKEEIASLLPNTKQFYFLATIKTADNDSTPILYLLRQNDKTNDYKLKATYYLNDLRSVAKVDERLKQTLSNGQQIVTDVFAFELVLGSSDDDHDQDQKSRYVWQCNKVEDRNEFLDTLWRLSDQFVKPNERPKFINYSFEKKKPESNHTGGEKGRKEDGSKNSSDTKTSDEDSLLKLMSECDFASLSAEKFIERLQTDLLDLDTSNIESIMNSEENTILLIERLDAAMEEIDRIDTRLKDYEEKVSAVGEAVRIVGEHDDVIQLQQKNQHALFDLLENMIQSLEYPSEYKAVLSECDLSSPQKVSKCVTAANLLLDVLETDLPNALKKMKSYEEQKKILEHLKLRFCNSCSNHLRNAIGHATNKHLESYKVLENSLNSLPPHKQIFDDLFIYRDLLPWMQRSGCSFNDQTSTKTYFSDIRNNYIEAAKQLYFRELVPFCNCARAKIAKNEKPRATGSMDNLKMAKSTDRSFAGDFFSVKIDQQTKETLKLVFIKLLNQITAVVLAEQAFCHEFFSTRSHSSRGDENGSVQTSSISNGGSQQLARYPSDASLASNSTNNSKKTQQDSKAELAILTEIFMNTIEEQVKLVMESIIRAEPMMIIFLYSDLLSRVLQSHNNKQYIHQPLVGLLRYAKEKCDEYCNFFKESIREFRVNKKEKIGLLRYVLYFEEFVKEAESCWEPIKKDMYEKLCIIYQSIVNEIFKGIESVAIDSQKTPPDVIRFQNYNQMNHIMRSMNGLKDSTKYAREQYVAWKQNYIKEYFGRPLEKIANFFEKVDAKIERGYKHENISYQLDLSANNLREIIKEYPAREVKRGLDNLYNRVEKHLVENSSLLEVVWCDMSKEFITQYKNYESLIKMCYPGQNITFEFTEQDICQFFQEIAQTH